MMNYKLEKFWNYRYTRWVVRGILMNYKLEKFWNNAPRDISPSIKFMNYKLEKFWNIFIGALFQSFIPWTINLKSFEILYFHF